MKKTLALMFLAIQAGLGWQAPLSAQSIHEVADSDILPARPGFVVALIQSGTVSFLEPFGTLGPEAGDSLRADHLFSFPVLTELLVGATAQALIDAEVLDPDVPISTFFPFMSRRLGTITLTQLLTHSSGLDDARIPDRFTWSQVMDQLNDAVLFTDPGVIHSRSRYDYPLALRVIEKAVGRPFPDIVESAILDPLEMTRSTFDLARAEELGLAKGIETDPDDPGHFREVPPEAQVNGLPVLFTTAEDVLHFLASWMGGGIKGELPWAEGWEGTAGGLPGDQGSRGGLDVERSWGHLRASREGSALGSNASLYLFPEASTAVVGLGIGRRPSRTIRLALDRITQGLTPPSDPPAPASAASLMPTVVPKHQGGWAGRYLNGDRKVELTLENGGLVYNTATEKVDIKPGTGGFFTLTRRPTGEVGIRFQLVLDDAGRRYSIVDGKAFIHERDARVYPHGER